jgi:hypothetical protein
MGDSGFTLEEAEVQFAQALGPQVGETLTLRKGSSGEGGHRVRLAAYTAMALLEAGGCIYCLPRLMQQPQEPFTPRGQGAPGSIPLIRP